MSVFIPFLEYYVKTVPWCDLTPTAHKPLDHGKVLLELIPPTLTPAMLDESPAEAANKFTKVIIRQFVNQLCKLKTMILTVYITSLQKSKNAFFQFSEMGPFQCQTKLK